MARVKLRSVSRAESRLLRDKLKDLSLSARVHQRYRISSEVLKGHGVAETADRVGCHFTVAYDWIRRFNKSGFKTFEQVPNPRGRPPILKSGPTAGAGPSCLVEAHRARLALLQLVGTQVVGVLPVQGDPAAGD